MTTCTHLDRFLVTRAARVGRGLRGLPGDRRPWLHLRICLECGKVGCCDDSPNRHASAHAPGSGHPLIRSLEPGEEWSWCFVDDVAMVIPRRQGRDAHPALSARRLGPRRLLPVVLDGARAARLGIVRVAGQTTGLPDAVGAFAVAIHGSEALADEFADALDDYRAIMVRAGRPPRRGVRGTPPPSRAARVVRARGVALGGGPGRRALSRHPARSGTPHARITRRSAPCSRCSTRTRRASGSRSRTRRRRAPA